MSEAASQRRSALGRLAVSPLAHVVALLLLGLLAYSNSLHSPFYFDDLAFLENPQVRSLENIPDIFLRPSGKFSSRALMHATFAVNFALAGGGADASHMDTTGFHVINVGLHLINGVLLYLLVVMTAGLLGRDKIKSRLAALFISSVFLLHPVQTEAVTYLVSRSMLLAATFYLLGMILFIRAVTSDTKRWLYVALLFTASLMGMASRENFVTFPLMLVLFDMFFISKFKLGDVLRHFKAYIPVFLSIGYLAFLVMTNTYDRGPEFRGAGMPHKEYFLTQFNVHWTYLRLLLFPVGQNLDYDYPAVKALTGLPTVLSLIGYAGLWLAAALFAKRRPAVAFGILWFLIALIPIAFAVTFMDMRLDDVIFEHRLYLPSIGVISALGALVVEAVDKLGRKRIKSIATVMLVLVPLVLSSAAYARNGVWSSQMRMWEDVARKSPGKARAHNNLGNAYDLSRLTEKAILEYERAIALDPFYADPHINLGIIFYQDGRYEEAVEHFQYSIYVKPDVPEAHFNLALALIKLGRPSEAKRQLGIAADLKPYPEAHYRLGIIYLERGDRETARMEFVKALSLNPSYLDARLYLDYMDGRGNPPPH